MLYALPVAAQAKRVAWFDLLELAGDFVASTNVTEGIITFKTGTRLLVSGAERPHRLEGNQYAFGVVDERSDQRSELITHSLAPAFMQYGAPLWQIGVPKRFGVGARKFRDDFHAAMVDPTGYSEAYSWPSREVQPPEVVERAKHDLTEKDFLELYEATWQDLGSAVYDFDEQTFVHTQYNPSWPIYVGCDFNVDPMCWVLAHVVKGTLHVFDELHLRNVNTEVALKWLHQQYLTHQAGWIFHGDAAASQRKTSSTVTDLLLLKAGPMNPKRVEFASKNPLVEDRVRHLNACFRNANDVRRIFINPNCVHLRRDLEAAYRNKLGEVGYPEGHGHMSDALGYLAMFTLPTTEFQPPVYEPILRLG